jgi:hypothetical protein
MINRKNSYPINNQISTILKNEKIILNAITCDIARLSLQ